MDGCTATHAWNEHSGLNTCSLDFLFVSLPCILDCLRLPSSVFLFALFRCFPPTAPLLFSVFVLRTNLINVVWWSDVVQCSCSGPSVSQCRWGLDNITIQITVMKELWQHMMKFTKFTFVYNLNCTVCLSGTNRIAGLKQKKTHVVGFWWGLVVQCVLYAYMHYVHETVLLSKAE